MKPAQHARIPNHPFAESLLGARLDSFYEETVRQRGTEHRDLVVDYHAQVLSAPAEIAWQDGRVVERVKGWYVPRRLRFQKISTLCCEGFFTQLATLPLDHNARTLLGVLSYASFNSGDLISIFLHHENELGRLWVYYQKCAAEDRSGAPEPFEQVRDWSPPPALRTGLIPMPQKLRQRFGGDPVTINLHGRMFRRRLFVGFLDAQSEQRPDVDAVLNLGEEPSRWVKDGQALPPDRWIIHGEGSAGMSVEQIMDEAQWVIERLRAGQRVLVHCVAGFNRSVTIACATLILLEGLSAEAALNRVRDQHAWARPDQHHWLALMWIAKQASASGSELNR